MTTSEGRSDLVVIRMDDVSLEGFVMASVNETDLVVRTVRDGGWWSFERPLPAVFLRCAQTWPGLILDIGANTGFYSFLGLSADSKNRSIAFEPDPRVLAILKQNADLNTVSGRLAIKPIALSDRTGKTTLFIPSQEHGLVESSSSLQADFKVEHSEQIQVEVSRLDDILPETELVSLVKIDVEGHEKSAVVGAEKTFARCRPIIAIEFLNADYRYFNELKSRLGYRSVALQAHAAIEEVEIAFDPLGWNHVLVPEEKWERFSDLLKELSLMPT